MRFRLLPCLLLLLCLAAYFVPNHLRKKQQNPPVGVYIAFMGLAAAIVSLRKEPSAIEKALWIALITTLMFAEVRNAYVEDAAQLAQFKATKEGLDATAQNSGTLVAITIQVMLKLTEFHVELVDLDKRIAAAMKDRNPQLATALQVKKQKVQQQADSISDPLRALGLAPIIVQQLRDWFSKDQNKREDINHDRMSEVAEYTAAHPDDTDGANRIQQKWDAEDRREIERSETELKSLMANADFVCRELIKWVPAQLQNASDTKMEQKFAQAQRDLKGVDPMQDAAYLENLLKRVRPPM
jgi:hypothetical protein